METVVLLQRTLYDKAGVAAAQLGISRDRLVTVAVEKLLTSIEKQKFFSDKDKFNEYNIIQNASMSDIWDLIKDDEW